MSATALEIENLHLAYGPVKALSGIDLVLERGKFLALLGPSGCGKTSLLRSVAGFVHPQEGRILIGGRDVVSLPPRERRLGMVFQSYALFGHMTAAENVAFGLKCRRVPQAEIAARVRNALAMVGLEEMHDRRPGELSGGQQQRVALARALVIEPDLLLLDEPLGALDKKLRVQMQTELKALQRRLGITTIFVTHDQEEALAMADCIAIMREGAFEQVGPPEEIFSEPATVWAAEFVGSGNVLRGRLDGAADGLFKVQIAEGCDFTLRRESIATRNGEVTVFVRAEKVNLEPAPPGNGGLEVISHRFLGVHVEVQAAYPGGVITALVPSAQMRSLRVGTVVRATADPADCRIIAPRRPPKPPAGRR